jgi:hypothetical protein
VLVKLPGRVRDTFNTLQGAVNIHIGFWNFAVFLAPGHDRERASQDLISKKSFTERTGRVAQGVGPEFKPRYRSPTTTKKKIDCVSFFIVQPEEIRKKQSKEKF